MILIEDILIDEQILSTPFSCDLGACKGACCTIKGGEGAPLDISEVESLQQAFSHALPYLSNNSKEYIEKHGFISGSENDLSVTCIDNKDCVFVFYDEQHIAKCALEKSYFDGKSSYRKPISCHLFPIRVRNFGGDYLSFSPFEECKPAYNHGISTHTKSYESVKEALIRAYGEDWYNELRNYVKETEGGTP
jgi:hypothetical protein